MSSRVPQLRARRVTWELPSTDLFSNQTHTWVDVEEVRFRSKFNRGVEVGAWLSRLTEISFTESSQFDQPIVGVVWPASLKRLVLGGSFNQSIEGVSWPASVEQIVFAGTFNQPIERVTWPRSLQQLTFGFYFVQPIRSVRWPTSLEDVTFGFLFDQPIEGVTWPTSLRRLMFGFYFNQPIDRRCHVADVSSTAHTRV